MDIDTNERYIYKNFTPAFSNKMGSRLFGLSRDVTKEEVRKQNMDAMPGFNLTWYYSGMKLAPVARFNSDDFPDTKSFIRYCLTI